MRRMDRYSDETENLVRNSRMDKNQDLYHNLSSNAIYTNITDVTNANAFEINNNHSTDTHTTREAYQQMQKYQTIEPKAKSRKELDDYNFLAQTKEKKTYDINSFLEEARKNRPEKDSLDEKRKLKNNAYNILASINKEQLEKYREEKKNRIRTPEEEELHDLTEDLLSKTLAGEIDAETTVDLLSDLMATSLLDTVSGINPENTDEIQEKPVEEESSTLTESLKIEEATDSITEKLSEDTMDSVKHLAEEDKNIGKRKRSSTSDALNAKDPDFYTRSMDLSDKDFDFSAEFNEGKVPVIVKILIVLLIIAIIAVAGYFIYQRM